MLLGLSPGNAEMRCDGGELRGDLRHGFARDLPGKGVTLMGGLPLPFRLGGANFGGHLLDTLLQRCDPRTRGRGISAFTKDALKAGARGVALREQGCQRGLELALCRSLAHRSASTFAAASGTANRASPPGAQ